MVTQSMAVSGAIGKRLLVVFAFMVIVPWLG
jgi:hypothetical protein